MLSLNYLCFFFRPPFLNDITAQDQKTKEYRTGGCQMDKSNSSTGTGSDIDKIGQRATQL